MSSRKKRAYGISSWVTYAVLQELEAHGVPAGPLLARHRLKREDLLDPDGWIAQFSHRRFYQDAIAASGDPAFQILVGRRVPIHVSQTVGYCAATSSTLREAYETFGRFSSLVVDGSTFSTRSAPGFDAVIVHRPPALPLPEDGPSFAAATLAFFAQAAGRPVKARKVLLVGRPLVPPAAMEAALGCSITWNSGEFEIRFDPETLEIPVVQANPRLKKTLESVARRMLTRAPSAGKPIETSRVRDAILKFGLGERATVEGVADALGVSRRTLQRRLEEQACTFSQLREEAIREAALAMLARKESPVEEVAFRLGFSSRTAFHRAIRRWTGQAPGALRAKSVKPGPA
jgi:AraC-like DNA-binding protein